MLDALLPLSRLLWKDEGPFAKWVAVDLLSAASRRLEADHWKELHGWIRDSGRADLCDAVAADLLGALVRRDRAWCRVLRHWTQSESVWERRASVVAVSPRVTLMTDVEAGLSICEALMRDSDPLIHEVVSALLREARGADPIETQEFLDRWTREGRPEILNAVGRS